MTIFVSVPAYREVEMEATVSSLLSSADNPRDIHVSVFDQSEAPSDTLKKNKSCTYRWIHYSEARGAGYARSEVQRAYSGEDYYFQIDSHSLFVNGWDTKYKEWLARLPADKPIISSWPQPYTNHHGKITLNRHENKTEDFSFTNYTVPARYQKSWVGARRPLEDRPYEFSAVMLAGQVFTIGRFVEDVPYDPRFSWHCEEFMLSVRAYCAGYVPYGINDTLMYHNYERHGNPRVWRDKGKVWQRWQLNSLRLQGEILGLTDTSKYAVKDPALLEEYLDRTGLTEQAERSIMVARQHGR